MQRILIGFAAAFTVLVTVRLSAQNVSTSTTFTQVTQSPPYLNCQGRLEISDWQGTVWTRGSATIRDAAGQMRATYSTGAFFSPNNPMGVATEYGTQDGDIAGTWTCALEAEVMLDNNDPFPASSYSQETVCPGTPGQMRKEYLDRGVNPVPACSAFVTCCGTGRFSWSELNGHWAGGNEHPSYGMVTEGLKTGLETTREYYGRGGIRLSSGYRCPDGNARSRGVSNSLHMQGRAADMFSVDHAWTQTEFNLLKAAAETAGATESLDWDTYPDDRHYHAAW